MAFLPFLSGGAVLAALAGGARLLLNKNKNKADASVNEVIGNTHAYAAFDSHGLLTPYKVERRACGPSDVSIKIKYCGMCHSDLHQVKNEWGASTYPMVPGHEIVGVVQEIGAKVTKFRVGQSVGVGVFVDSCRSCGTCKSGEEQYCKSAIFTYNCKLPGGGVTYGGYSQAVVVDEGYVLRMPTSLPLDAAAPLLCAGITVWSPIKHYGLDKKGLKVGVMGLGGLGHIAVKLLVSLGVETTVISSSASKGPEAISHLKAHHFLLSSDKAAMAAAAGTLDGIINTVSAPYDIDDYASLLVVGGKMILVGLPKVPPKVPARIIGRRLTIAGSMIGGIKETQEMLDYCGRAGVSCDIERVDIGDVNTAMERMLRADVRYRFVIDVEGSLTGAGCGRTACGCADCKCVGGKCKCGLPRTPAPSPRPSPAPTPAKAPAPKCGCGAGCKCAGKCAAGCMCGAACACGKEGAAAKK